MQTNESEIKYWGTKKSLSKQGLSLKVLEVCQE